MTETEGKKTIPFQGSEASRIRGGGKYALADGVYRVLATLELSQRSYRVFAELLVDGGQTRLRLFRFAVPTQDEWLAERKIILPVTDAEIAPVAHRIFGAEFVLCAPVRLDESRMAAVFGSAGLPAM